MTGKLSPSARAVRAATRPPGRVKRRGLPKLWEFPIPPNVRPGKGWTAQMREMADHVGAYATLCIVAELGGQQVTIPSNWEASPFRDIVDVAALRILARVYGANRLQLPVARTAVDTARRAVVIAAVREGKLTGADAQRIIGTSRSYVAHLVNHTDEGQGSAVDAETAALPPRQRDLFSLPSPDDKRR